MVGKLDIKPDFGVFDAYPDLAYFDSASTTLVPKVSVKATADFLNTVAVSSRRGAHKLAVKGSTIVENVRISLAKFMNMDKSEISFHDTVPCTVASFAYGYDWHKEGRNQIVIAQSEEHSVLVALLRVAEVLNLVVKIVPVDQMGTLDTEALQTLVNRQTGIVAVGHTAAGVGARNPLAEVARIVHENEAVLLTDATRSLSFGNDRFHSLGMDVLVLSGNVGFMGSPGLVIQWIDKNLGMEHVPGVIGGSAIGNVTPPSYDIAMQPDKFESGIINVPAIAGLGASLEYIRSFQPRDLSQHIAALSRYMTKRLAETEGLVVYGSHNDSSTIFGFNVAAGNGISCHDVSLFLDQSNIAVRSGLLCAHPFVHSLAEEGIVQASLHAYNSLDDIDRLADSLQLIVDQLA
ncbi:MAG: hypothetical protein C4K49_04415 [Candidatus Thorarchaeota archaeon]|nr:MAG: hypothetical protein C4K49_04415 [Candidatus Thorarchaeota archaeon]